jgi:hypothetical protein
MIPYNIIMKALHDFKIRTSSLITNLKYNFSTDHFSHIVSFRRPLYINPKDFSLLPISITITQDDATFHIFIADDSISCFLYVKCINHYIYFF